MDYIKFTSIIKTAELIRDYWVLLLVLIAIILRTKTYVTTCIKEYKKLSEKEKLEAALKSIETIIQAKMAIAQLDWSEFSAAGTIKRSQVLNELYNEYPILKTFIDQESVLASLDDIIDRHLDKVKEIVENIKEEDKD